MTRALYNAPGSIIAECIVRSSSGRGRRVETQHNASVTVSRVSVDIRKASVIRRLKLDALYQHMIGRRKFDREEPPQSQELSFGEETATVEITRFNIFYDEELTIRKRERRYDRKDGKYHYYSTVRWKKTGRLVGRQRWKQIQKLEN